MISAYVHNMIHLCQILKQRDISFVLIEQLFTLNFDFKGTKQKKSINSLYDLLRIKILFHLKKNNYNLYQNKYIKKF